MRRVSVLAALLLLECGTIMALDNPRISLAVDSHGTPLLAWVGKQDDVARAYVSEWNGTRWLLVGSALNQGSKLSASYVSLALDGNDTPIVAWTERPPEQWSGFANYSGKLRVERLVGSQWKPMGGALNQSENTIADQPLLRLDSKGRPMITWSEITSDFNVENVFFAKWGGDSWQMIDNGTLSTDVSTSSRARDFVFDSHDRPILTWSQQLQSHQDFNIFVGHWDGRRWQTDHGTLNMNEGRYAGAPVMELTKVDQPMVAFLQADKGFDLYVRTWNGTDWVTIGNSLNDRSGGANGPRIALKQDGSPLVAWLENSGHEHLVVKSWDGAHWQPYGGILNRDPQSDALACDLRIDPEGHPVVAWTEVSGLGQVDIELALWNGQAWSTHQLLLDPRADSQ